MLNKDEFYQRVNDIVKGNWGKLFLALIIISAITQAILAFTANQVNITPVIEYVTYVSQNNLEIDPQYFSTIIRESLFKGSSFNFIVIASAIVSELLMVGYHIRVLGLIEVGEFNIFDMFKVIERNFVKYLIVSFFYAAIIYALNFIPVIGSIIVIIAGYGFAYYPYLLKDNPELDYIDYFKSSWELTNGHKFQLFKIDLYYAIRIVIPCLTGLLLMIILLIFRLNSLVFLGILALFIGFVWSLVLVIKYGPYINVAKALYYANQIDNMQ